MGFMNVALANNTAPPPAALAIVPQTTAPATQSGANLSLYAIEEHLEALAESAAMVGPDQEEIFLAELQGAMVAAVEKRDQVGWFMANLEGQIALAASEIKRLQDRKAALERWQDKMEQYLIRVVQSFGTDAKGKYKKLEGDTVTFSVQRNPSSVTITDEAAVPTEYKSISIKLPATEWEGLLDSLDLEVRAHLLDVVKNPDVSIDKKAVKAAIEGKTAVPGADLVSDRYRLVRK